jgi:hypothetical protein
MKLDDRYRVLAFADADEVDEQAAINFWLRQGAMSPEVASERIAQLACVAVDRDAGLVGVSTAYLARSEQLRTQMWHYRVFVGADHRAENISRHLLVQTTLGLQGRFVTGEDTRAPGMVMEIENEGVKRRWNFGVWHDPAVTEWDGRTWPWTFIGENRRGDHVRVHWFPGAEVPLP